MRNVLVSLAAALLVSAPLATRAGTITLETPDVIVPVTSSGGVSVDYFGIVTVGSGTVEPFSAILSTTGASFGTPIATTLVPGIRTLMFRIELVDATVPQKVTGQIRYTLLTDGTREQLAAPWSLQTVVAPVPEPSSLALLMAAGVVGFGARRLNARKKLN